MIANNRYGLGRSIVRVVEVRFIPGIRERNPYAGGTGIYKPE